MYNYIKDSFIKLVVDSVEKSLKEKIAKELLSYMSRLSGTLKYVKYFIKNCYQHYKTEQQNN